MYYIVKRVMDFCLSLLLLCTMSWLLALCAAMIKLTDPRGSVMYTANRAGKGGRVFRMYKFRTVKTECTGQVAAFDDTLTPVGRILRKLSLDELPQLVNILKGDMSFIGPRPLLPRYLPFYTREEFRRHQVLPGITGLAQTSGRVNLNWNKRFVLDVQYVDNLSLSLDLQILRDTVWKVFSQEDVLVAQVENGVTAPFDQYREQCLQDGLVAAHELAGAEAWPIGGLVKQ